MRQVMDQADIARVLTRIAHEIVEQNTPSVAEVVLIGVRTRGVPLAQRLASRLVDIEGRQVPVGSLDIGPYRDDLDTRLVTSSNSTEVPFAIDGQSVVLVDDVLYTGRTIRAALDALADVGRAGAVQLATLIDRGHRELPLRPDFVGKNLPTAVSEHVAVLLEETDGRDGVWIERANSLELSR